MPDASADINAPRDFALQVVKTLRGAGFEALWAGGCVRDALLGTSPKDYDVATSATPEQVISLFGRKKTIPVGASFGVIMVSGSSKACGQVEVATFRKDGEYLDGRRPSKVTYCSAEEDARRRDFTINGMFYDPLSEKVIDYVGGRSDLKEGIVRAIGDPAARFTEDKLRMLRAVRFSATYEFLLEDGTAEAIRNLRSEMIQVSAERIAQELRRMLAHPTRSVSFRRLEDVGLLEVLFPSVWGNSSSERPDIAGTCDILAALREPVFEPALSIVLRSVYCDEGQTVRDRTSRMREECRKLKLSNEETATVCWITDAASQCRNSATQPLHVLKPLLASSRRPLLFDYLTAGGDDQADIRFLRDYVDRISADRLNPSPLVNGIDLQQLEIPAGPKFKELLTQIRAEQLDELLVTREQALDRLRELAGK